MSERRLICSADEVRGFLDGRKTMFRRPLKNQPFSNGIIYSADLGDIVCHDDYLPPSAMLVRAGSKKYPYNSTQDEWEILCPFGAPGDRLWVAETWQQLRIDAQELVTYRAGCKRDAFDYFNPLGGLQRIEVAKWRSSATMQRWASRITLDIVSVRVERLQSISEADARAEGAPLGDLHKCYPGTGAAMIRTHRAGFGRQWDRTPQGKRHPWSTNPFVWVVELKRVAP